MAILLKETAMDYFQNATCVEIVEQALIVLVVATIVGILGWNTVRDLCDYWRNR